MSASSPAADGEPLTPGLLAALLALHVHHGRLEEALGYQRRLQRGHDPTLFLDQFKQLDLAALLVRRGHSDGESRRATADRRAGGRCGVVRCGGSNG